MPVEALVARVTEAVGLRARRRGRYTQRPVVIGDNDGSVVRLASGLREGELVALNVGDNVGDGARVQPVAPPPSGGRDASGK